MAKCRISSMELDADIEGGLTESSSTLRFGLTRVQ